MEVHVVERGLHLVHIMQNGDGRKEHWQQVRQTVSERSPPESSDSLRTFLPDAVPGSDAGPSGLSGSGAEPTLTTGEEGLEQQVKFWLTVGVGGGEDADDPRRPP